jgi:hypothetical protein
LTATANRSWATWARAVGSVSSRASTVSRTSSLNLERIRSVKLVRNTLFVFKVMYELFWHKLRNKTHLSWSSILTRRSRWSKKHRRLISTFSI